MLKKIIKPRITTNKSFQEELYKDNFDEKLLKTAISNGKVDLNFKDKKGNSFLNNCISKSKQKAALWLLKQNIDITLENNQRLQAHHLAIEKENKEVLVTILDKEIIDINEKDIQGRILLQDLVVTGQTELAKVLIDYGSDINSTDKNKRNVIFDALSYGNEQFVNYLLSLDEPKIELNNVDANVNTIMHHSEVINNKKLAKTLIEAGADVTIQNAKGETFIFDVAVKDEESKELLEVALKSGMNANSKVDMENTIFMELTYAFSKLSVEEVQRRKALLEMSKLIVTYGGDVDAVNNDKETPLFQAIRVKDFELVAFLLSTGVDPNIVNKFGHTALLDVVYQGIESMDILLLMLKHGASPLVKNLKGQTMFEVLNEIILHNHNKKIIEDERVTENINAQGQYMGILKELLKENKEDLNFLDSNGNPLFFTPLLYDDGAVFRLYINNGLNIHLVNKAGHNIFYEYVLKAFEDNNPEIKFQDNLSRLVSKKVNHNFQDVLGWTILHKIVGTRCDDVLFDILTKVVRFNFKIQENMGRTIIHNAVWNNNQKMIKKINRLDKEVINMEDNYGILPVTYAALLGSQELVLLFIELKVHMRNGRKIPPNAVKKFTPMLKNLPKIKEGIKDPIILEKLNSLIYQTQVNFNVPESLRLK